jgi:hypothetical protein
MEDVVGLSLQTWLVASTIIATLLFGLIAWKSRRAGIPVKSFKPEGILLLCWWIVVLGACAYGFMMGMGG